MFFERAIRLLWKRSGRERRAPSSEAETVGGGTMVATEAMGSLWYYVLATAMVAVFVCVQFLAGKPKYAVPQKGGEKKKKLPPLMDCGLIPGIGGLVKFVKGESITSTRRRLAVA